MVCLFFVVCAQMICYKILKEMQHCTAAVRKLPGLTCGDTNRINMEHTADTINLLIFYACPFTWECLFKPESKGFFRDPN